MSMQQLLLIILPLLCVIVAAVPTTHSASKKVRIVGAGGVCDLPAIFGCSVHSSVIY